ncbi:hypothetical protein GCK72_015222 [Caenorhabditis remanei]|uniref:Uncharacterized protein n=1 Tax=Caenorhabditis remanei TaxID=31234 RepID=A0A6A5GWN9_CAERE|nr:hypothetical protein GCK72_015222 [Caenorhabditis remanei]KAF1758762.1 hypothetical protein GCK72_015222 [Caenorhabditis remanei]
MDYATAAKEIVKAIQKADAEMKKRIRKMMKQRTLEDVAVLQTMLERVSESSNKQLKIDFEKHRIPERLKKVASLVTNTHYHGFAGTQGDGTRFTLFTCLRNEGFWIEKQRAACGAGAVAGLLLLGGPTIYMGFIIADMQKHLGETETDLKFVVEEIESIYDQTNSLMLANIV